ncbi:MAG TPA: hypothetical protein VIL85_02925 [Thermomicrobiales bacterium]|jgi:hypothetical protein
MTEKPQARRLLCSCGAALGTIARERGGPVTLTPAADATFVAVTGTIVWLRCACGVDTPWFIVPWRGAMPPPRDTL